MKTNIADDEKKRNFYCNVIMEEVERMDTLVKDLLDLSQIESGMFGLSIVRAIQEAHKNAYGVANVED